MAASVFVGLRTDDGAQYGPTIIDPTGRAVYKFPLIRPKLRALTRVPMSDPEERLMLKIEGVLHFTIPVKDLDRSEKFYEIIDLVRGLVTEQDRS
jgi:hypothetical protein